MRPYLGPLALVGRFGSYPASAVWEGSVSMKSYRVLLAAGMAAVSSVASAEVVFCNASIPDARPLVASLGGS
jgi:hypothetical protein